MTTTNKVQRGDKVTYQGRVYRVWYARGGKADIYLDGTPGCSANMVTVSKSELVVL